MLVLKKLMILTAFGILTFCLSCSRDDKYNILIFNNSDQPVSLSIVYYTTPNEIDALQFEDLYDKGTKKSFSGHDCKCIFIHRDETSSFKYFWAGIISDDKSMKWVINQNFEIYDRHLLDISEGLRIDFTIEPDGTIDKEYWS